MAFFGDPAFVNPWRVFRIPAPKKGKCPTCGEKLVLDPGNDAEVELVRCEKCDVCVAPIFEPVATAVKWEYGVVTESDVVSEEYREKLREYAAETQKKWERAIANQTTWKEPIDVVKIGGLVGKTRWLRSARQRTKAIEEPNADVSSTEESANDSGPVSAPGKGTP